MFKSGSTRLVRDLNKQHVLNLVRMSPGTTARDISRITGLQISTVLYTLHALNEKGFIHNDGFGESTRLGGKRPLKWKLAPGFGTVIGVELLSREIRIVLLDFSTTGLLKQTISINRQNDPEILIGQMVKLVQSVLETSAPARPPVLGLGIGIPGSVSPDGDCVRYSSLFPGTSVSLLSKLTPRFPFPVYIENTANAGALSVKWLMPELQEEPNILYVSVNQNFSGMGAGFIINHELYRGKHGAAGEIRDFLPTSTLKTYIDDARNLFTDNSTANIPLTDSDLNISGVLRLAQRGDPGALYIFECVGRDIADHLITLMELFDPGVVVIGGDMCEAKDFISGTIIEQINRTADDPVLKEINIRFSPFSTYAVAMGSAALVFEKIFRPV